MLRYTRAASLENGVSFEFAVAWAQCSTREVREGYPGDSSDDGYFYFIVNESA
jgi:hypothetical protein